MHHFCHFTLDQNKVSKTEVVETVIPAAAVAITSSVQPIFECLLMTLVDVCSVAQVGWAEMYQNISAKCQRHKIILKRL